jgi:hypothetical protein
MEYQVTCITRVGPGHEHITHLGGRTWGPWTVQKIMQMIRAKTDTFYTLVNGRRAEIGINGSHLQTHADGYWNNNLLALDACAA